MSDLRREVERLLASKHECSPILSEKGRKFVREYEAVRGAGDGLRIALLEANSRLISDEPADADQQRSVTLALSAWAAAVAPGDGEDRQG